MAGHTILLEFDTQLGETPEESAKEFLEHIRSGKNVYFTVFDDDGGQTQIESDNLS